MTTSPAAASEAVLLLVEMLEADPMLRGVLEDALRFHADPGFDAEYGFTPGSVHASGPLCKRLVSARVMNEGYTSGRYHNYALHDPAAVREALALLDTNLVALPSQDEPVPLEPPPDLFDTVEGLAVPKKMLLHALTAPRPVHVLLEGGPGSAKSLLLDELLRLPGSRFARGGDVTRAGLLEYLLSEPAARLLVVDEMDKMGAADLSGLLDLMETGRVTRLQHRRRELEYRVVWVMAGCNRTGRFRPELLDRFHVQRLRPYTRGEYEATVQATLTRREGIDPLLAQQIAGWAVEMTRSVRATVRLARASKGDPELARELAPLMLAPS